MKTRIKAACAFRLVEWLRLFHTWWLLLVVDVALRVLPFATVQKMIARRQKGTCSLSPSEVESTVQEWQQIVAMAGRYHLIRMGCLRQSLVLQRQLGRCGIATRLQLGVRKEAGALHAHAWLERDGQLVGQAQAAAHHFTPLAGWEIDP